MKKKQHYKRFFVLCALFGLITSSVCYASEDRSNPFPSVSDQDQLPLDEILPGLPEIVKPEDQDPDPVSEPIYEPGPEKEEEPENEDPSGSTSENEVSENTISGNDPVVGPVEENTPGSGEDNPGGSSGSPVYVRVDDVNADNFYKYSLSADNLIISQLSSISYDLISVNEVLRTHEKTEKNINTILSRIDRNEQTYQKAVLECLLSLTDSISGNKIKVSADEIRLSLADYDQIFEVSENMISENDIPETVSGNDPEPDPETVSDDDINTISDDVVSISKGDLDQLHKDNEQLHDDLKSIFYVGLFGVIFLAMIAAGNLEQIIFKRLRG